MHVVLTRPEEDNAAMRAALEAQGITVSTAPMLSLNFNPLGHEVLDGVSGLIVTSRNALKAIDRAGITARAAHLPVFAVGPATAALARTLGFTSIIEGPGTAETLTDVIARHPAARGTLLHVTGNRQAYDLGAALAAHGIAVRHVEAYRMVAAQTLPDTVVRSLAAGGIDAVILMSPETARAWMGAIGRLPVKPDLTNVVHLTLSAAVAKTLGPDQALKIEIASAPNAEQMLALTFHLAAKSKAE